MVSTRLPWTPGSVHSTAPTNAFARLPFVFANAIPAPPLWPLSPDVPRIRAKPSGCSSPSRLGVFRDPKADALMARLVAANDHKLFRTAALSGMGGRELEFLKELLTTRSKDKAPSWDRQRMIVQTAQCVLEEGQSARVGALFDLLAQGLPERTALLEAGAIPRHTKPIALDRKPAALTTLLDNPDRAVREAASRTVDQLVWPGARPALRLTLNAPPLTPRQEQRVRAGQKFYTMFCAACHQPEGGGNVAVAPPLAGSDWVAGPPERLAPTSGTRRRPRPSAWRSRRCP